MVKGGKDVEQMVRMGGSIWICSPVLTKRNGNQLDRFWHVLTSLVDHSSLGVILVTFEPYLHGIGSVENSSSFHHASLGESICFWSDF